MTLTDVPDPEPGPGQIFVRVLAASANFPAFYVAFSRPAFHAGVECAAK